MASFDICIVECKGVKLSSLFELWHALAEIIRSGEMFTMHTGYDESETMFAGCLRTERNLGGRRGPTAEAYGPCLAMTFVWCYEVVEYKGCLALLRKQRQT